MPYENRLVQLDLISLRWKKPTTKTLEGIQEQLSCTYKEVSRRWNETVQWYMMGGWETSGISWNKTVSNCL